jgi:hypothetical protein
LKWYFINNCCCTGIGNIHFSTGCVEWFDLLTRGFSMECFGAMTYPSFRKLGFTMTDSIVFLEEDDNVITGVHLNCIWTHIIWQSWYPMPNPNLLKLLMKVALLQVSYTIYDWLFMMCMQQCSLFTIVHIIKQGLKFGLLLP